MEISVHYDTGAQMLLHKFVASRSYTHHYITITLDGADVTSCSSSFDCKDDEAGSAPSGPGSEPLAVVVLGVSVLVLVFIVVDANLMTRSGRELNEGFTSLRPASRRFKRTRALRHEWSTR